MCAVNAYKKIITCFCEDRVAIPPLEETCEARVAACDSNSVEIVLHCWFCFRNSDDSDSGSESYGIEEAEATDATLSAEDLGLHAHVMKVIEGGHRYYLIGE
jgi:hypothetical protein